ncbi:NADP-dependent oxidoreductase [Dyadobacter tibetensis]|uniref:NADP-dependent oxidoreductase n=1 Tax=Dyadobacter tibetensis TaxID=1211851 RepID=UPI0004729CE7|nr:NADP-dependent oxidoreductase [Dyadobacter tibetensis]
MSNRTILLNSRPVGMPTANDFKFVEQELAGIQPGEILLKTRYVSVDPYLRGRMSDAKSYVAPFELDKPINSGVVAEVIESQNDQYSPGDWVIGALDWSEMQISNGKGLNKIDTQLASPSAYLGVLGMTGLTAYFGLGEIGRPKEGETVVVSGAAGAVGSIVGQIAKIKGARVIGIAGNDEKVQLLKSEFGYDEAINYNSTEDMPAAIAAAAPNGVDVYFDNVGGEISDAVYINLNKFGRIAVCGSIAVYNETERPVGPRIEPIIVKNSILMQGFIVSNYAEKFPEGVQQLSQWVNNGSLKHVETIIEGFDNIPKAFIDLFSGANKGKMIVKVD